MRDCNKHRFERLGKHDLFLQFYLSTLVVEDKNNLFDVAEVVTHDLDLVELFFVVRFAWFLFFLHKVKFKNLLQVKLFLDVAIFI